MQFGKFTGADLRLFLRLLSIFQREEKEVAELVRDLRFHDMRHTFTLSRLLSWYREGADVQRLLPQLATYLGHVHIAGTQHYLAMTPELLRQASLRFERYALGGDHHA